MEGVNTVELVGFYGGDETHATSAWTSTSRDLTDEKRQRIPALLKMLADNDHGTPFEKSFLHFLVTTDIATHIHLIKHRIGVSVNAESARYRALIEDKALVPSDWPTEWQDRLLAHSKASQAVYREALDALTVALGRKRAKESARFFLPYATQITSDVAFNFRSFILFQKLRNSEHAQREVRKLAQTMLTLVHRTGQFTHSLEAFGYVIRANGSQDSGLEDGRGEGPEDQPLRPDPA